MVAEPHIVDASVAEAVRRTGGVTTTALVTRDLGATAFLTGITELPPGGSIPLHTHNCEESVTVLSGRGAFEWDGGSAEMSSMDTTLVPAGLPHRFLNPTSAPLRIFWVYGSANATRTIVDTGETFPVGSHAERDL
jgi:quercetin dioxygenase-like cupin family protein